LTRRQKCNRGTRTRRRQTNLNSNNRRNSANPPGIPLAVWRATLMQREIVWRGTIPVANPSLPAAADRRVVLVVSPDTNLREAAARALERDGFSVVTAAHGGHAVLACLKAGRVDVLATELSMEDVSGPALASRLRKLCPEMATVFFANAGTAECAGILVRPFTRDDLLAAVALTAAATVSAVSAS
jgi:CheY-like chemotaxis protein